MGKNSHNILAINPGSRYFGVAVFHNSDLREWTTKVLSTKPLRQKIQPKADAPLAQKHGGFSVAEKKKEIKSIISEYLDVHSITIVALKQLHPSRTSSALSSLVSIITTLAQVRKRKIVEYSIDEIKQKLISSGRLNKKCLMDEVALRYPYLHRELERERKHKNPYLIRMFEAVALGTVCWNDVDSKGQKIRLHTQQ